MKKVLVTCGIISPVLYGVIIFGGARLWPGYSHNDAFISELLSTKAPNSAYLNILMAAAGILLLLFQLRLKSCLRTADSWVLDAGISAYVISQLFSLLWLLFPDDTGEVIYTLSARVHLIITSIVAPMLVIAFLLIGIGIRRLKGFGWFSVYAVITALISAVLNVILIVLIARGLPNVGLIERINMFFVMLFPFTLAARLLLKRHLCAYSRLPNP